MLQNEKGLGQVKYYPYKKGFGKGFNHAEGGWVQKALR